MPELGKILVILGVALALLGLLLWSGWGRGWLGHLPGDVRVDREGFSLRFPIVTCLLASLVISALLWLFRR
ncbi:MAG: DUF2905 domain-containing protein [Verrucomicrobiales bacterium]|nr:DUF2905 domain-containing protein [Verrucomicrobiales bacterium]